MLLHRGRNFHAVHAKWQRKKDALAEQKNARLRHPLSLNHPDIDGEGAGWLAEHQNAVRVDAAPFNDISERIKEH